MRYNTLELIEWRLIMSQELEIEFKTLLSANDYQKIYQHYQLDKQSFIDQTNIYFDTPDQKLRQKRFGLRIRQFEKDGELTLKCPTDGLGLLEITDYLSAEQLDTLIETKSILKNGAVAAALESHDISTETLQPVARLRTKRYEIQLPIGLLALDESWYGQAHDYELELEVTNEAQGKHDFEEFLARFNITQIPSENKIIRAIKNQ